MRTLTILIIDFIFCIQFLIVGLFLMSIQYSDGGFSSEINVGYVLLPLIEIIGICVLLYINKDLL